MRAFEMAMGNEHFTEIVAALKKAFESVPENLRQQFAYQHFLTTLERLNLELCLDLLEEISVDHEPEMPKIFWQNMLEAAHYLRLADNSNYYRRMLRENQQG